METHGTGPGMGTEVPRASSEAAISGLAAKLGPEGSRQVTCSDCGHVYLVAEGQQSAHCRKCGNIEFLPAGKSSLSPLTERLLARRVLPRLEEKQVPPADTQKQLLESFRATPDGRVVEELRMRYQVEWQLWAVLARQFHDHAYHMAYVCQCASLNELDKAAARYREHRNVMALSADTRWQAEVSELILSRIESIAALRITHDRTRWWDQLPARIVLMKTEIRALGIGWIVLGLILGFKLLNALAAHSFK